MKTMTWSRHSRRIEPISLSAYAFCHGERGDVDPVVRTENLIRVADVMESPKLTE